MNGARVFRLVAVAIGVGLTAAACSGWTLTDLMENLYLRQAGAAKYDQLSTHKLK